MDSRTCFERHRIKQSLCMLCGLLAKLSPLKQRNVHQSPLLSGLAYPLLSPHGLFVLSWTSIERSVLVEPLK